MTERLNPSRQEVVMALKIPRCARCSGACALETLPSISGEDGPLKLTVLELPVFACAKKHEFPVHRDFMLWLIQEIRAREAQIAAGKQQVRSTKELHDHVAQAIVAVNDGAGFPHSG